MKIIVAMDANGGIGFRWGLPWRNKHELQHFKKMTMGCRLIVGRRTGDTLPKLEGRELIIVSKNGISLEQAFAKSDKRTWVIGGADIYKQTIPFASEIHVSLMDGEHQCDTWFPELEGDWEVAVWERREGYRYILLKRRN